jgi:hypothetical protein
LLNLSMKLKKGLSYLSNQSSMVRKENLIRG